MTGKKDSIDLTLLFSKSIPKKEKEFRLDIKAGNKTAVLARKFYKNPNYSSGPGFGRDDRKQ